MPCSTMTYYTLTKGQNCYKINMELSNKSNYTMIFLNSKGVVNNVEINSHAPRECDILWKKVFVALKGCPKEVVHEEAPKQKRCANGLAR